MKTEKTLKIEFENGEVEVLKNICQFTDFFLASACVTGGSGEPYSDEYKLSLQKMIDGMNESRNFIKKINKL